MSDRLNLCDFSDAHISQEINPFTYVEINGLKISEPSAAYCTTFCGKVYRDTTWRRTVTSATVQRKVSRPSCNTLRHRGPGGHAWSVAFSTFRNRLTCGSQCLMDELDQTGRN